VIEVELPDGSIAEFPAGTSDADIMKAVKKFTGPSELERAQEAVRKMGPLRRSVFGIERSFEEGGYGLKQIFPKALGGGLTPQNEADLAMRRQMEKEIPGSWIGRMTGDLAQYAAPTAAISSAVTKGLPMAINALSKIPTTMGIAGASTAGAGVGALQPVIGEESRGTNAAVGAGFGAGGQMLGNAVGRGIEGVVQKNPSIMELPQKIRDKLSLGQTADRDGLMSRVMASTEEKLQSVPIIGDIIRKKREGARDSWRDDLVKRVSPGGFSPTGENTREKLASAYGEYKNRYASALANHQVGPSQLFESQVGKITNNPRSGLTSAEQAEIRKKAMDYYESIFHGNSPNTGPAGTAAVLQGGARGTPISADAATAKQFEAFLTGQASQYRKSNAPNAQNVAQMYDDLERAWSTSYKRQLPLQARRDTKALDQTYAPYKTVERAASYVGNDFGDFTPQQLLSAVKARTSGPKFARGGGILQDEAQAARDALVDRIPNSGTADRASTFAGMAGALYADPMTAATTLGLAVPAMTTRVGRNIMTGDNPVQVMLKKLRVNNAARNSGALAGTSFADIAYPEYSEQP
jgi:hypothetical protein